MGEGWTPLITTQVDGQTIHLKLESLNPTGSFKDRGATLVVSLLKAQKVNVVHDDSSGNAGVALAAYSARAGIAARIFVPAGASPVKLGQIALYGAQLDTIPGPRSAATVASQEAANTGTSYYASHIYHPFAILAYKSTAYELWEQLGHRAPDAIILPLGHGSQLLGLARGFEALLAAGLIARLPRLIGVQARACAPLWQRYHQLSREAASEQPTLAEGIRIIEPVRVESILEAVKVSNGDIVSVDEDTILDGLRQLAKRGISAEPTSAVVWPALKQATTNLPDDALIVLSITGSGYKTPHLDKIANHSDF
jgi:threonine synthase